MCVHAVVQAHHLLATCLSVVHDSQAALCRSPVVVSRGVFMHALVVVNGGVTQLVNNSRHGPFLDDDVEVLSMLAKRIGDVVSELLLQQRVCGAPSAATDGNAFELKRSGGMAPGSVGSKSVRSKAAWTVAQSSVAGDSFFNDDMSEDGEGKRFRDGDLASTRSGFGKAAVRLVRVVVQQGFGVVSSDSATGGAAVL